MSLPEHEVIPTLMGLADLARSAWLHEGGGRAAAERAVVEQLGPVRMVLLSGMEWCDIQFSAAHADRPSVGDVNSHQDQWLDDHGQAYGSISGQGWKIADLQGDVMSYYRETAQTPLGQIEIAGIWNSSAIWQDRWQSLPATGVSGELRGMIGVRQLHQVVPRERYRYFVLLLAIEDLPARLQQQLRYGSPHD